MAFLQNIYYKLENGYYAFLDKLDKAGLHVYKVVDPIDKVIPSFVLILIIFGLIVAGLILYFAFSAGMPAPGQPITFYLRDNAGQPLANAQVTFSVNDGNSHLGTTNAAGVINFAELKPDDVVDLNAYSDAGEVSHAHQIIEAGKQEYNITLKFSIVKETINFSVYSVDNSPLKPIDITFSCPNGSNPPQSIVQSTETDYSVQVDPQCGDLYADIQSESYQEYTGYISDLDSIPLSPLNYGGNNSIVVSVVDNAGNPIKDGFSATLSMGGIVVGESQTPEPNSNSVTFTGRSQGKYTLTINKSNYIPKNQDVNVDTALVPVTVTLQKDLKGVTGDLVVKVEDIDKNPLYGAKVIVYKMSNGLQGSSVGSKETTYDNNAKVNITVPDASSKYWVQVTKSGYNTRNLKEVSVSDSMPILVTLLHPSQVRKTKIKVVDADNAPVYNATVAIYDDKDNVIDPMFGITDFNGVVDDKSLDDGNYKAYVYKGAYSGYGDYFEFDPANTPASGFDSIVKLTLPKSSWEMNLVDPFGNPVPNALVQIYDAYAASNAPINVGVKFADPNGTFSIGNLSADKKYFAVISAKGFENYVTIAKFLDPNSVVQDTFVLEKQSLNPTPVIKFIDIEDTNGHQAIKLGPDNTYVAKFKIVLPEGVNYSNLVANFLSGDPNTIVQKDMFYIKKVEVSGNPTLAKGDKYVEGDFGKSIGPARTTENVLIQGSPFEDQIKWVQLSWNLDAMKVNKKPLTSGELFVNVYLKVKYGTLEGTMLPLSFNIFASGSNKTSDNVEFTYPKDDDAKSKESSLFNRKSKQIFSVGSTQQVCNDKFCFEMTIFDLKNDLKASVSGDTPYIATIGNNYNMKFSLMNNNSVPVTNYRVIIENPQQNLHMTSGRIYTGEKSLTIANSSTFNDYFKEQLRVGADQPLYKNEMVSGDINFIPIVGGPGSFKITVIQDKEIFYTKELFVNVMANKTMNVDVEPKVIPSYVKNDINFTVKDANTEAFIKGAKVRIVDVYDHVLNENFTNKYGFVDLNIVGQLPNVGLKFMVYKDNYKTYEKNIKTSDQFITFDKNVLKISALVSEMHGLGTLNLTNTSQLPVKITSISLSGNFDEYVNLEQTNNYLQDTALDKIIDKGHSLSLPVNVSLTTIAQFLKQNIEYPATLDIKIKPEGLESNRAWEYKVPVTLAITLGKGLDNLDCLGVDVSKSKMVSTSGKPDNDMITITNGCSVNSKPVQIVNLEAKASWKGNALGSFTFNRNNNTASLQSAYYVTLNNRMLEHESDSFVVNFVPVSGRVAGSGKVELDIRAGYFTNSGIQFVDKKVNYDVSVINMASCISYEFPNNEVDLISVPKDEKTKFTIKNACANDIDLKLNPTPDQFLDIRPLQFTVPANGSKEISVDPNGSPVGVYLLEVTGKTPKHHFEGIKTGENALRVFVSPTKNDCLILDNYEFNFKDSNKNDVNRYTYVINRCYYQDIKGVYKIDVKAGGLLGGVCTRSNWFGLLKSSFLNAGTSALSGYGIGKTSLGGALAKKKDTSKTKPAAKKKP